MTSMIGSSGSGAMIRVISMPGANERREAFTRQADVTNVNWSFFDAQTSAQPFLINNPDNHRASMMRELLPAEIGCYSSHVSVWKEFIASDAQLLVVFEDDIVVDWKFVEFLVGHDFEALGIHYLKLFNKIPVKYKLVMSPFLNRYYHLVQNLKTPFGTQAYLLTRTGARRMVEHTLTIRRPIDSEMDRSWEHGLPSLTILPAPLFERFSVSSIGEGRFETARRRTMPTKRHIVDVVRRFIYNHTSSASHASWYRSRFKVHSRLKNRG